MDRARQIAEELVDKNPGHYMVRVFFYAPVRAYGSELPLMRFEWTKAQGLVLSYDVRLPPPREKRDASLPEYEVLSKIKQTHNRQVYGEVLVPSLSPLTPITEREADLEEAVAALTQRTKQLEAGTADLENIRSWVRHWAAEETSAAAQPTPATRPVLQDRQTPAGDIGTTVYVARTGGKYHRSGCGSLSKSKIPIALNDAMARYEPCKRCRP